MKINQLKLKNIIKKIEIKIINEKFYYRNKKQNNLKYFIKKIFILE